MDDEDRRWIKKVLDDLWEWKICQPFRDPVDPVENNCPDYYSVVKQPMDLQTVKYKFNALSYNNITEFVNDLRLICYNAKTYNGEDTLYGKMAGDVLDEVNRVYDRKMKYKNEVMDDLEKHASQIASLLANPPPEAKEGLPVRANNRSNNK